MRSDFVYKWRLDYLRTLQSRSKWLRTKLKPDVAHGKLYIVLIVNEVHATNQVASGQSSSGEQR